MLIKGSWGRTFCLMELLGFFSIFILTEGISVIFYYLNLTSGICSIFDFIGKAIPLTLVNRILVHFEMAPITVSMISKYIFLSVLSCIIAGLTLPIRSICWSLWYKNLADLKDGYVAKLKKRTKRIVEDGEI